MMKCGIDGRAQTQKGHEKRPNEKYGRDKTEVWEIELFNLAMVLPKEVQELVVVPQIQYICSLWWKDKFPQYRVFRNCRGSEKAQYNDKVVNVFLVMQRLCPTIQTEKENLIEPSREACEEPDCMSTKNCVVWTAAWA